MGERGFGGSKELEQALASVGPRSDGVLTLIDHLLRNTVGPVVLQILLHVLYTCMTLT